MKVRFLFFRAKFEFRNFLRTRQIRLVDDGINIWTCIINLPRVIWQEKSWNLKKWCKAVWQFIKDCYAHAEVWTPDKEDGFTHPWCYRSRFPDYAGTCWTSTLRDNYKGTCKRSASEVLKHPERWDYAEIDIPEDLYYAMQAWMDIQVENNKGYDKKAILSFFWPKRFHNADKFMCSEFTYIAAVMAGILHLPYQIVSPRRLARIFVRAGYEIKRLK